MRDIPPLPPIPDGDEDWSKFPNDWDFEYMKYREELEAFSERLKEIWRAQPIPLAEYKDGALEVKWDGTMYPVSKRFYTWLHGHKFGKDGSLAKALWEAILARKVYARKRG